MNKATRQRLNKQAARYERGHGKRHKKPFNLVQEAGFLLLVGLGISLLLLIQAN